MTICSKYTNNLDDTIILENIIDVSSFINEGTETNPYIIDDYQKLQAINENLKAYYQLANDIDMSLAEQFVPINKGMEETFTGNLDGQNYKIMNLSLSEDSKIALFNNNSGTIKNIQISNFDISGINNIAMIAVNNRGTISNIKIEENNRISSTGENVGTVAATNTGTITLVENFASVNGVNNTGGIVGSNYGDINKSYNKGIITGITNVGGISGTNLSITMSSYNYDDTTDGANLSIAMSSSGKRIDILGNISEVYNENEVVGETNVGGISGYMLNDMITPTTYPARSIKIQNSYNKAKITGDNSTGGIVGYLRVSGNGGGFSYTHIINCYNNSEIICDTNIGGIVGRRIIDFAGQCYINNTYWNSDIINNSNANAIGTAIDTNQMKNQSNYENWDFENIWEMSSEYPILRNIKESI